MSRKYANRVRETSTTAGNGSLDLAGASTGYQGFVAGVGDAEEVYYTIAGVAGQACEDEWEVGIGTINDAAPDTLDRDTVLASSNGGAKVNFSAGTKDVFLDIPEETAVTDIDVQEPSGVATFDSDISDSEAIKIVGSCLPATDDVIFSLRLSNDGGASFRSGASDYRWARWTHWFTAASVAGSADSGDFNDDAIDFGENVGNASGEGISFTIDIISPAESGIKTRILGQVFYVGAVGTIASARTFGEVQTAEVNNAVRLLFSAGNIASGRIAVYRFPAPA